MGNSMIKLCIIDDEEEIREGISNNVDWGFHKIQLCGVAGDGDEAVRLCEEQQPDIILLDINMPGKSGLEVAQWIYQTDSPTKVIILSGYDNFSYAQQALRYGVTDYLLKPCRSSDILNAVLSLKKKIEQEQAEEKAIEHLKAQYDRNSLMLRERFLVDLMLKRSRDKNDMRANFVLHKIRISPSNFCVAVIMIDDGQKEEISQDFENALLMKMTVRNILEEILGSYAYEVFEYSGDIVLLFNSNSVIDNWMMERIQMVQNIIAENLRFTISAGFGTVHKNPENIIESYQEAFLAAEAGFFTGASVVTRYEELNINETEVFTYPMDDEKSIIESICICNQEKMAAALGRFIENIKKGIHTKEAAKSACLILMVRLAHLARKRGLDTVVLFGKSDDRLFETLDMKSIDLLHEKLNRIAVTIIGVQRQSEPNNQIITNTIQYVHNNYMNDISLEMVAQKVYISSKYLSALFKKSVGRNFSDYVHGVRIKKACELLRDTRMMVYDIASTVGYKSEKHFSRLFRAQTGMTPGQFRNML